MPAMALPQGGIVLHGAPDGDLGSKNLEPRFMQAMQLDLSQDVVDELLESTRSGKLPQLLFGRTPQIKFGNRSIVLHSSPESYHNELYQSSADDGLEFAGLVSHNLAVQKAEDVTAGVDTAVEQLRNNMAAISEFREANKTIVGDAASIRTPGHRRFPSKGFKTQHLGPSSLGSPMPTASSSPMLKAPTSQPSGSHDVLLRALRVPLIHLLAVQPSRDTDLADTCRTSLTNVRELLPKIAKRPSDSENWQLTDKSFRELTPWKFTYKTAEDRERAIDSAIKAFDRLRLAKDDKLWQNLLPAEERGQGKCLSRLNVKAPEQKPATPLHKMPKLTDKKHAASKKGEEKSAEKGARKSKEPTEVKPKKVVKEDTPQRTVKVKSGGAAPATQKATPSTSISSTTSTSTSTSTSAIKPISTPKSTAPSHRHTPSADTMPPVIRQRKVMVPKTTTTSKPASTPSASATPKTASTPKGTSTPKGSQQPKPNPKPSSRGPPPQRDRVSRPAKPYSTLNTKPKNPSPLSASPPVNASDFEDTHPVHKALAAAPSPAKAMSGNSDHTLKRKANDTDSDIHNHNLSVKQARVNKTTPVHTPSSANGLGNGTTPASGNPLKRKSDDSSSSDTSATKVRKVANIDTGLASRYPNSDNQTSPDDTSSSSTSPAARLSFRQTVELSQRFQQCYKKYEELYWQLAEAKAPPTDAQRSELMKMHHTLEKMKREIRSGVGEGR